MLLCSLTTFFVFQATVNASTTKWNTKLLYVNHTFNSPKVTRIRLGSRNLGVWRERLSRSPDDKKTPRPETRSNELSGVEVVDWVKLRQLKDSPLERAFTATDFWSDQARLDKQNRETQTWFALRCRLLSHAQLASMLTDRDLTASSRPFGIPKRDDRLKYLIRIGCLYRVLHIEKLGDEHLNVMIDAGLDVTLFRHWNEFDGGLIKRLASLANRYASWQMPASLHGIDIIMKHPAFVTIGWMIISSAIVRSFVEQNNLKCLLSYAKMLMNTKSHRKMSLTKELIAVRLIWLKEAIVSWVSTSQLVVMKLRHMKWQLIRRFGPNTLRNAPSQMYVQLVQRLTAFPPEGQRLLALDNVSMMDKASWITDILRLFSFAYDGSDVVFAHLLRFSKRIHKNGLGRDILSYLSSQSLPSSIAPLTSLRLLENIARKIQTQPIRLRYRLDAELQLVADRARELEDDTRREFFKSLVAESLTWIAYLGVRSKAEFQLCHGKNKYLYALEHSSVKEALSALILDEDNWHNPKHKISGVEYSGAQFLKLIFDHLVESGILVPSWRSGYVVHPQHASEDAWDSFLRGMIIYAENRIAVPSEMYDAEAYQELEVATKQPVPAIEKWMGAILGTADQQRINNQIFCYTMLVSSSAMARARVVNLASLEDLSSDKLVRGLVKRPPVWIKIGGVQTQWPKIVRLVTDLFIQRQDLIPSWIPGEFVFRPNLRKRYWTFYFDAVNSAIDNLLLVPAVLIKAHHLCYPDRPRISQWMATVNGGVVPTEADLNLYLSKFEFRISLSGVYADALSPVSRSFFDHFFKHFWEQQESIEYDHLMIR